LHTVQYVTERLGGAWEQGYSYYNYTPVRLGSTVQLQFKFQAQ